MYIYHFIIFFHTSLISLSPNMLFPISPSPPPSSHPCPPTLAYHSPGDPSPPPQCKHDFCWVCLEVWRKHSSSTGGYFRCNRFEAAGKVSRHQKTLTESAESRSGQLQALNRFVHYYTRFKNHENSLKVNAGCSFGYSVARSPLAGVFLTTRVFTTYITEYSTM